MIPAIVNAVLVPPVLALGVSIATIAVLVRSRAAALVLDRPTQRSLHITPTPRLGGIGIIAGVAAAWLYAGVVMQPQLIAALVLLIGISLLDDLRGVGVQWRFIAHLASAALGVITVLHAQQPWLILLTILATTWMINLYNFMDGSDGLAGGMAVIGFGAYGVGALIAGDFSFGAVNLSIATAALGFVLFNFPPARIFMGDAGAIPLGFLAAIMNIAGTMRGVWPAWFPFLVFAPFILDASVTLARRAWLREKVWEAHRDHYYQRLIRMGWGHRKTAIAEYVLMAASGCLALAAVAAPQPVQVAVVATAAVAYISLIAAVERAWRRFKSGGRNEV